MILLASGPVIVEAGKMLANQHGDTPFWKFCGGRVEDFDADLIENARREAREEMGIELKILNPEPFLFFTRKETPEGVVDVILAHFLAERVGEINPSAEIRVWRWLDLSALTKENLAPNILPALQHFGFAA